MATIIDGPRVRCSNTPPPATYDEIIGNKEPDQMALPTPAEILAAHQTWTVKEELRKRTEFYQDLPEFRRSLIAQIKASYIRNDRFGTELVVPNAMAIRTDLLDPEIIDWLSQRGWKGDYHRSDDVTYLKVTVPDAGNAPG